MTHLSPEEFVDVLDGAPTPAAEAHLNTCDECRRQALDLGAVLATARTVEVPEPSPLFWDRFAERVRAAVGAAPEPQPARRWFHWPVLAPLGALALLVMVVASAVPEQPGMAGAGPATTAAAAVPLQDPDAAVEAQWHLVAALVGDLTLAEAGQVVIATPPGSADRMLTQLSPAEQEELLRLLQEELHGTGG